jgi:AraC-like DNA-binding protein
MSLEEFFAIIKDGTWHNIEELSDKLGLSPTRLLKLSNLLAQHCLIKYEEQGNKIKLEPKWRLLLPEEENPMEPKTTTAIFMMPPDTSIDVQLTQIRNLTGVELEISLRIDNQIKEIAIRI